MLNFPFKEKYSIDDLLSIMKILRSENGCPWDKEQTHSSIRSNLIEETYEACEAIDKNDSELLKEELGDVLLQVVFHSQIEQERNGFDFNDVADDVCKKLIVRHPHVFGDKSVENSEEVLKNWDSIKKETKNQETYTETLKSIPDVFPSLMKAQKVGKRAARAGMDFVDVNSAFCSLSSEVEELGLAITENSKEHIADELGDVIFSAVNVSRKLGLDAEEILTMAIKKFINRFEKMENQIRSNGINMKSLDINELDFYWNQAKMK